MILSANVLTKIYKEKMKNVYYKSLRLFVDFGHY